MRHEHRDKGFTLIELMITVMIIGILVAICVPVFNTARNNAQSRACFANERAIEGAYQQYMSAEATVASIPDYWTLKSLVIPSRIATEPHCPAGGTYSFTNTVIYCTLHDTYHNAH